jgi:hypothetical protein
MTDRTPEQTPRIDPIHWTRRRDRGGVIVAASLNKDAPILRPITPPGDGAVVAIPESGGLHHRYERRAA